MKTIIFLVCMSIVSVSFAVESETACEQSADSSLRQNPKGSTQTKGEIKRPSSSSAQ